MQKAGFEAEVILQRHRDRVVLFASRSHATQWHAKSPTFRKHDKVRTLAEDIPQRKDKAKVHNADRPADGQKRKNQPENRKTLAGIVRQEEIRFASIKPATANGS
jgi:hypothetical protein